MNRLALFAASSLLWGCAAQASANWSAAPPPPPPPPPSATFTATATVDTPAPAGTVEVYVAPAPEPAPEEVIATSEPPEPVYEEQDDMPGPGMFWVGGYWQWSGNDWAWYYGSWQPVPEGRVYIAPYYEHVDDHVVYVRGYWGGPHEEPRYYGGDRIVFTAAVRPAGYVRGAHPPITRSVGLRPGSRGNYGPRPHGIKPRPLPTATAPRVPVSHDVAHVDARGEVHGNVAHSSEGAAHAESGHPEGTTEKPEEKPEARPEAKPESRPEPKAGTPQPKPAPKPAPKPHRK